MKILNQLLAGKQMHFLGLELSFDAEGHIHLEDDEKALALSSIPGFEIVNEQLDAAVTKAKGPGKKAASKGTPLPEGPRINGQVMNLNAQPDETVVAPVAAAPAAPVAEVKADETPAKE